MFPLCWISTVQLLYDCFGYLFSSPYLTHLNHQIVFNKEILYVTKEIDFFYFFDVTKQNFDERKKANLYFVKYRY